MASTNEQENTLPVIDKALGPKANTVLQAARKIFLAHGFSNATTDMIQREAGVSKSTVYAHFANKETLFSAVVQAECFSTSNSIRTIKYKPGRLPDVLHEVAQAYLKIVLSKSGAALARIVIAEVERFPSLGKAFYESGPRASIKVVTSLLGLAEDAGDIELGVLTSEDAARIFIGSVRSELQLYYLTHPDEQPTHAQKEQWITFIVNTFTRAYAIKAP